MKRKYLSALLMGTLTVASMSTFTSCKDYDDDISNLQEQIDKLATADQLAQKVSELQALISSNQSGISSLETKLAEVKATADSKATLDEVKTILADYATNENVTAEANKIVDAAIKALQEKDIAELKAAIETAKAEALKGVEEAKQANADVLKNLTENYSTTAETQTALNTAIEALKTDNAKALQDAVDKIYKDLEAYAKQEKLDEVSTAAQATQKALEEAIAAQKTKDEAAQKAAQQKLDAAVKALETKIATAQKAGDDAKKDAADNASEIETLAKTVKTAGENLAKVQENLTKVEDAVKTLGAGFDEKNTVEAAIKAINGQLTAKNTGLAGLDERLSAVETALKGDKDGDKLPNLKLQVDNIEKNLKDIIGQYSTMVTDVQLFNFAPTTSWGTAGSYNYGLTFIQATEQANVFPGAGVADAQFTFEKGKYFAGEDSLLVRVSPVNAELTTSNVSLMNSQGQELNDLIEVTDAHRYNGLISRASNLEKTGLWVVKFKAKDLGDAFKSAAETKVNNVPKSILYSVAVKNTYTTDKENTRRVTSEYGVSLSSVPANHAYDFAVNNTPINEINNRYNYTGVEELVWKDNTKPATTVITEGDKANAVNRPSVNNDDRHDKDILAVEKGGNIVIDFTKTENASSRDFGVKGFYVTLDEKYALESAPSEINAWNSYSYENVGYKKNGTTYQPAKLFTGNKGTIKIQDLGNVKGDVIGFRVYAVNYDGTLTDPDGRAFYVAVGDAKVDMTIPATTVSLDMATANATHPTFVSPKVAVDFSKYDFDADDYDWAVTAKDKSDNKPTAFEVKYFKANGTEVSELSKDVKFVQFVLTEPNQFVDDETYTVSTTLKKGYTGNASASVSTVTASFKKEMPKEAPVFGYRDGFDKYEYIIPTDDYTVNAPVNGKIANKGGNFDFRNILIINNNLTAWNGFDLFNDAVFDFNVSNATYKTENNKLVLKDAKTTSGDNYILAVNNSGANLVDNKTEHTITANFIYNNISKRQIVNAQNQKEWKTDQPYPIASASSEKIVYCSWMKTFNVSANGGDNWTGRAEVKDKNGNVTVTKIDPANVVTWSPTPQVNTLYLNKVDAKVADLKAIPTSVASDVKFTNLASFFNSGVITLVKGAYGEVWTTSTDGKQYNPYFKAEYTNGQIKLIQLNQTAIPSAVKGGLIHFTIRDCFGNTKAIQLPFVINMPEVTAKKH